MIKETSHQGLERDSRDPLKASSWKGPIHFLPVAPQSLLSPHSLLQVSERIATGKEIFKPTIGVKSFDQWQVGEFTQSALDILIVPFHSTFRTLKLKGIYNFKK